MITTLTYIGTLAASIICGALYAYLFIKSRIPLHLTPSEDDGWRKRILVNTFVRFIIIAGAFGYLLRLPIADRILFLMGFLGSFWYFIFISQRRYYGR